MTGTAALLHERFDAQAVNRAIDEQGVTLVSLVPTMLARLLDARQGRPFPGTLRAGLIGGGPAEPALLERRPSTRCAPCRRPTSPRRPRR